MYTKYNSRQAWNLQPQKEPKTRMNFSILCKVPVFGETPTTKNIHKKGIRDPRLCRDGEFKSVDVAWLVAAIRTINKMSSVGSQTSVYTAACHGVAIPFDGVCTETARYVTVNVSVAHGLSLRLAEIIGITTASVDPAATVGHLGKTIPQHPAVRAHDNLLKAVIASTLQTMDEADTRLIYKQVNDTSAGQVAWIVDELTHRAIAGHFHQHSMEMGIVRAGKPPFTKGILSAIFDKTLVLKKQLDQENKSSSPSLSPSTSSSNSSTTDSDNEEEETVDTLSPLAHFPPLPPGPPPPPPSYLKTANKRPVIDTRRQNYDSERLRRACMVLQSVRFPLLTPLDTNTDWAVHACKYHRVWC
jgi:hypothetical protein